MIVVDPGVGHASYPLDPNTETLVLRFSARAMKDFTPEDQMRKFSFASDEDSRNSQTCRMIRYFAAQIVRALWDGCVRPDEKNIVRSSLGMIAYLLSTQLPSEVVPWSAGEEVDPASSLKAFNQLFLDNFRVTPKEYRSRLIRELSGPGLIPTRKRSRPSWTRRSRRCAGGWRSI